MLVVVESPDGFVPMQSYFTQNALTLYEASRYIASWYQYRRGEERFELLVASQRDARGAEKDEY